MLGRNKMASGREEALKHVLLVLEASKRGVYFWQRFSNLGLALTAYLRCLRQCRQFGWHCMVPL